MKRFSFKIAIRLMVLTSFLCADAVYSFPIDGACHSEGSSRATRRMMISKVNQTKLIAVKPGIWGSAGFGVTVQKNSVKFEFDCAEGSIARQLMINKHGSFRLDGTYTPQSHGPIRIGRLPKARPARYEGEISGKTMRVKLTLTDTGEVVNTFAAELDKEPRIRRCR